MKELICIPFSFTVNVVCVTSLCRKLDVGLEGQKRCLLILSRPSKPFRRIMASVTYHLYHHTTLFACSKTLRSSSAIPSSRTGFRIIPFIPISKHLSHTSSSALAVKATINGQLRLLNFRILIATSKPSNSGIWRSKRTIWKEDAAGPRAPRHSNPDETTETMQPSFSRSFLVTALLVSSSSANRTWRPLKRELECGCSEDSPGSEMLIPMDGWSWKRRTRAMLLANPWGFGTNQMFPCINCQWFKKEGENHKIQKGIRSC